MTHNIANDTDMTTDLCLNHCKTKGRIFYMLWKGSTCGCPNTITTESMYTNSRCDKPCTGEEGTEGQCGGESYINLYGVAY